MAIRPGSTAVKYFEGRANCMWDLANFTVALAICSLAYSAMNCTLVLTSRRGSDMALPPPCLLTIPNDMHPRGERVIDGHRHGNHGNGKLWTTLPADGKLLIAPEKDGSLGWKFPWWRAVRGRLTITGRRLDAHADPLRASIPGGYGETGFQASSVIFPNEGCWEITGRVDDADLTFVVEVRIKR